MEKDRNYYVAWQNRWVSVATGSLFAIWVGYTGAPSLVFEDMPKDFNAVIAGLGLLGLVTSFAFGAANTAKARSLRLAGK